MMGAPICAAQVRAEYNEELPPASTLAIVFLIVSPLEEFVSSWIAYNSGSNQGVPGICAFLASSSFISTPMPGLSDGVT